MAVCANCEHPIGFHGESGCRPPGPACGCSWYETAGLVHARLDAVSPAPASERQVAGEHYRKFKIQPWDIVDEYELSYYAGSALKYLLRAGHKGAALEDLKKCRHYLDKLIELEEGRDG